MLPGKENVKCMVVGLQSWECFLNRVAHLLEENKLK